MDIKKLLDNEFSDINEFAKICGDSFGVFESFNIDSFFDNLEKYRKSLSDLCVDYKKRIAESQRIHESRVYEEGVFAQKDAKYTEAVKLFNCQKYLEAYKLFTWIKDHKNANDYITKCTTELDRIITSANLFYNEKNYCKAIEQLKLLSGYKDSQSFLEKYEKEYELHQKNDSLYNEAIDLFNNSKFYDAYVKFTRIKDHKDANDYIAKCIPELDRIITSANQFFNEKNYSKAIEQIKLILGYKDSQSLLEKYTAEKDEKNAEVDIISRYLACREWDKAQEEINKVLLVDNHNAKAHWYSWMCDRRLSSEGALICSFSSFTRADGKKLNDILANSSPEFAKHIVNLLFEKAYLNDNMCFEIMSVILPYAKNESLLSKNEFKSNTSSALKNVISKVYPQSFDYLIKESLDSSDVDTYISYLQEFGDKCRPQLSQKYYHEILKIYPENIALHNKLVMADIKADSVPNICVADFENLLKYSENADKEVVALFNSVTSGGITTFNNSQFVWNLIGYHSGAPEALKSNILAYSRVLLQSSLWDQARKFLQLILSFDPQNADAYWLLCLEKLKARTEKEIKSKKDNLIDCPEFQKSLVLYQSAGNEQKVNELMSYTQKQKAKKKATKIGIIVGAAVIAFIALLYAFNLIKYNANLSVSFEGAPYADGWSYNKLPVVFKNKGLTDICSLTGVMTFYDEDGNKITEAIFKLSDLPHGEESKRNIILDPSSEEKLYGYHFESVKITWATTYVVYSDNKTKDYGEGKEKTIKKITKSSKEIEKAIEDNRKIQYADAMKAYDAVNINNSNFAIAC